MWVWVVECMRIQECDVSYDGGKISENVVSFWFCVKVTGIETYG